MLDSVTNCDSTISLVSAGPCSSEEANAIEPWLHPNAKSRETMIRNHQLWQDLGTKYFISHLKLATDQCTCIVVSFFNSMIHG